MSNQEQLINQLFTKYRKIDYSDPSNDIYVILKCIDAKLLTNTTDIEDTIANAIVDQEEWIEQHAQIINPVTKPSSLHDFKFTSEPHHATNIVQQFNNQVNFFTDQKTTAVISPNPYNSQWYSCKKGTKLSTFINHSLYYILLNNLQRPIRRTQGMTAFLHLIYYQNQHAELLSNQQSVKPKSEVNQQSTFVNKLKAAIGENTYRQTIPITVLEIADLIYRLRNQQNLTEPQTAWLIGHEETESSFLNDFVDNLKLEQYIQPHPIIKDQAVLSLIKQLNANVKVYAVVNQHPITPAPHTFIGIHGTAAVSIPSILQEGLKDYHSLKQENNRHYMYTGSGLGNGIYFARLNQFQKALNYTNSSSKTKYALIAQVSYHQAFRTRHYDIAHKQNEDLVIGQGVGSHDRDEIVAQSPQQVQIKYLLEITKVR